jgi:hypothetical protein
VGARIAEHARPLSLQGGTLVLLVATSVWAHELSFLTEDVLGRLRALGVHARTLRFRVGSLPAVERPPERRLSRAVPRPAGIPDELAQTLRLVKDQGLRTAIERRPARISPGNRRCAPRRPRRSAKRCEPLEPLDPL